MRFIEWLTKQYFFWMCFWFFCAISASIGINQAIDEGSFWKFLWWLLCTISALVMMSDTYGDYKKSKNKV